MSAAIRNWTTRPSRVNITCTWTADEHRAEIVPRRVGELWDTAARLFHQIRLLKDKGKCKSELPEPVQVHISTPACRMSLSREGKWQSISPVLFQPTNKVHAVVLGPQGKDISQLSIGVEVFQVSNLSDSNISIAAHLLSVMSSLRVQAVDLSFRSHKAPGWAFPAGGRTAAQSAVMISQEDLLSLWKTVDNVLTRPDYAELTRVRLRQQTPLTVLPNSYQYGNQLFRELLPKLAEKNVLDGYDGFCEYHE